MTADGIRTGVFAALLVVCSGLDLWIRKFPFWLLMAGSVLGTIMELFQSGLGSLLFFNLLPGLFLFVLSQVFPEQIGSGDGFLIMAVGALMGWRESLLLLEGGLLLMVPAAFFWMIIRKKRNQELPFAPFVLAGYLCRLVLAAHVS